MGAVIRSGYFDNAFNFELLEDVARKIKDSGLEFSHIACRGVSGSVAGSILSYILKKELIVVRKPTAKSHSYCKVENIPRYDEPFKYIFVDDFICEGKTFYLTYTEIENANNQAELVGMYLYQRDRLETNADYFKEILDRIPQTYTPEQLLNY